MISVIIPVYNRQSVIERSVRSVMAQTWRDLEIIVIDDASTDKTMDYIAKLAQEDNRIHIVSLGVRQGANHARNVGLSKANGDIIAFQDSDDEWFPNKLEQQIQTMTDQKADFVYCSVHRIYTGSEREYVFPKYKLDQTGDVCHQFLRSCMAMTPSIVLKRYCFVAVSLREEMLRFQEWDFVINIAKYFKIAFVDEILMNAYVMKDSVSNNDELGYIYMRRLYALNQELVDHYPDVKADYQQRWERYAQRMAHKSGKEPEGRRES